MKITLNIKDGLTAIVKDSSQREIKLQDGMHLKVESIGQIVVGITEQPPDPKAMQASSESGASGSLSFA